MEDEHDEEQAAAREGWVRRVVLTVLLVVGIVTTVFAVVASRPDADDREASDDTPVEVVTTSDPDDELSEGPLRLGRILVAGSMGSPVDVPGGTAESYAAALDAGVDYVEADVVMSKDGQLLVRSDNELSLSTDVADRDEYADRETTKTIDGVETTGWFSEDFTLDELRGLDATEPRPDLRADSAEQDGDYALIGFDDLVDQVAEANAATDREIGIFVRPRQTAYFRGMGLPTERAIASSLRRSRLVNEPERVTVESADLLVLERVDSQVGDNVLSAFVVEADGDSADDLEPAVLDNLPDVVDAVYIEVGAFTGQDPYDLADRIHAAGYSMGVFPISYENALLAPGFRIGDDPSGRGNLVGQVEGLQTIGVDVILAESPADVVEAVDEVESAATETPTETPSESPSDG